ncbi:MAG TPA: OmpA family protein [Chryseolinea sp.]|nr:OmpA family protein [Chryseolinea sp.]
MKTLLLSVLLFGAIYADAQKYVGPPNNVGREYGNPKMPLMVSHLAGANKERLKRANKNSHHSIFGKILCFRKLCRIQSGHSASLRAISFKKFEKKIKRNAKKGAYKNIHVDSTHQRKPVRETIPVRIDTANTQPAGPTPVVKADSLIVLSAEVLFETNKSTLRSEHFVRLNSIVHYLLSHPERSVRISGHTDNTGSEAHNLTLSKQRADVVAEYLVGNNIDINRVETSGLGSAKPIAQNTTEEGRKKNRRVELLIHDKQ